MTDTHNPNTYWLVTSPATGDTHHIYNPSNARFFQDLGWKVEAVSMEAE